MGGRFPPLDASILMTAVMVTVQLAQANLSTNNTQESTPENVLGLPLTVDIVSNIRKPGVLLYNRKSESLININYSLNCTSLDTSYAIHATTSSEIVAKLTTNHAFNISCAGLQFSNMTRGERKEIGDEHDDVYFKDALPFIGVMAGNINMTIEAHMIGRAFLILYAKKISDHDSLENRIRGHIKLQNTSFYESSRPLYEFVPTTSENDRINGESEQNQGMVGLPSNAVGRALIIVMQLPRTIDLVFRIVLYLVIILGTTGMGVKVDLVVIKQELRRPTGPVIGLCCQYICMPLIAFLVTKVVPQDSAATSLGIFTCGIVPGGGLSNMFTILLGGDVSLSITMTTMSTIASLALLPLWMFTLGETFKDDTVELHVPYTKIMETLAVFILPSFLGIFIQYKLPKVAKVVDKVLKPVLILIVAFIFSFGFYVNVYIFEIVRPMTIIAGCLLPYIGYLLGGFIAFFCFRSWKHIKTIAIETGIQNSSIAFLILYLSLPPPDNQLATVGPAVSGILTPLPLFVAVVLYIIYQRHTNKHQELTKKLDETNYENGGVDKMEENKKAKVLLRDNDTAAIVILWQKLTGRKPPKDVFKETTNTELMAMEPGK